VHTKLFVAFTFAAIAANAVAQGHEHDHSKAAETAFGRAADPLKAQGT